MIKNLKFDVELVDENWSLQLNKLDEFCFHGYENAKLYKKIPSIGMIRIFTIVSSSQDNWFSYSIGG